MRGLHQFLSVCAVTKELLKTVTSSKADCGTVVKHVLRTAPAATQMNISIIYLINVLCATNLTQKWFSLRVHVHVYSHFCCENIVIWKSKTKRFHQFFHEHFCHILDAGYCISDHTSYANPFIHCRNIFIGI